MLKMSFFSLGREKILSGQILATFCLALAIALIIKHVVHLVRDFPPGPWGVPILGYYPFLKRDLVGQFDHLAAKYGDIFSITLFNRTYILLNSFEANKQALIGSNALNGRPQEFSYFLHAMKRTFVVNS